MSEKKKKKFRINQTYFKKWLSNIEKMKKNFMTKMCHLPQFFGNLNIAGQFMEFSYIVKAMTLEHLYDNLVVKLQSSLTVQSKSVGQGIDFVFPSSKSTRRKCNTDIGFGI